MKPTHLNFNQHAQDRSPRKSPRPSPFCLRLSQEERALLENAAGELSLGEFIRQRLFQDSVTRRRKTRKNPIKDKQLLGQVLAELGKSRLPNNLNQIAKAINTGTLRLSPEVKATLLEACADIQTIRSMLVNALEQDG